MFFSNGSIRKRKDKIIIGENSERYAYTCIPISTHAEIDALLKLKNEFMMTRKRIMHMDLMVIRFSKCGSIGPAIPCYHCLQQLNAASFVNINNVYYSTIHGTIECTKFFTLLNTQITYISSGYRHRMKIPDQRKIGSPVQSSKK